MRRAVKVSRPGCVRVSTLAIIAVPALAADMSDLAARAATWEKEYNANNLAAVQALYATDGCRMPPNQEAVHGSEAILAQLKGGKGQGLAKVKLVVTATESSGGLGYGTGTCEILGADGSHVDHGKWMNVSKKSKGRGRSSATSSTRICPSRPAVRNSVSPLTHPR